MISLVFVMLLVIAVRCAEPAGHSTDEFRPARDLTGLRAVDAPPLVRNRPSQKELQLLLKPARCECRQRHLNEEPQHDVR